MYTYFPKYITVVTGWLTGAHRTEAPIFYTD